MDFQDVFTCIYIKGISNVYGVHRYLCRYPCIDIYFSPEKHRKFTLQIYMKSMDNYAKITLSDAALAKLAREEGDVVLSF